MANNDLKPIGDLRIRLWAPLDNRDPYTARIGNLPMVFFGESPMAAHAAADTWRKEEVAKHQAKEARKTARIAAASRSNKGVAA